VAMAGSTAEEKWRMRPAPGEWARASALGLFQPGRQVGWVVEIEQGRFFSEHLMGVVC